MHSKEFMKKAEKIGLDFFIAFDLLLVYKGARPACMHRKCFKDKVLKTFPFFKFRPIEWSEGEGHYISKNVSNEYKSGFFYIETLKKTETAKEFGEALGYDCPGDMFEDLSEKNPYSYVVKYYMKDQRGKNWQIYTHICLKKEKINKNKIKKFQKVADELNLTVVEKIEEIKFDKSRKILPPSTKIHLRLKYIEMIDNGEKKIILRLLRKDTDHNTGFNPLYAKKDNGLYIFGLKNTNKWGGLFIKKTRTFDSFDQALRSVKLKNTLPDIKTYKEGVEYYQQLYGKENEEKYGVIAIWI